jgi:hypothetical protein
MVLSPPREGLSGAHGARAPILPRRPGAPLSRRGCSVRPGYGLSVTSNPMVTGARTRIVPIIRLGGSTPKSVMVS